MTGPRTSKPDFDIKRSGGSYYVMRDGVEVAGPFHEYPKAEMRMASLERKAQHVKRPCITCRKSFLSEGAHNRMCSSCRAAASEMFDLAV